MHKLLTVLLCLMLLVLTAVSASALTVEAPDDAVIPGQAVLLAFNADRDGTADLYVTDDEGNVLSYVVQGMNVSAGLNRLYWNGTWQNEPAPDGEHLLVVSMDGETASAPITVGETADEPVDTADDDALMWEELTPDAKETETGDASDEISPAEEGSDDVRDDSDAGADSGNTGEEIIEEELLEDEEMDDGDQDDDYAYEDEFIPSYGSPYAPRESEAGSYWTTPMDITDTEAVWNMLMQPITVVDTGKANSEKTQLNLYREPDTKSTVIGVVTCASQSLRVLERGDDWTLVETYSSTFHDNGIGAWNMLVQGYIQTKYIKTVTPNQHLAFVVDKLTQRIYIFQDGELYDTLLVSTGLSNERQPYNETRSGEFLLQVPAVGGFKSDALICDLGIRFNDGDLLHELPHVLNKDGSKNYKSCEPKLGTRASHGCIRVQRLKTPKGTNMQWIWANKVNNMKIVIWEDWQGRQISYPDDSTPLYYNPDGGEYYHSAETCYCAKNRTFDSFTYGQLDDEGFSKLKRCEYCTAPLRKSEIDEINEAHAPGGDHDPILTAAREKWLNSLD